MKRPDQKFYDCITIYNDKWSAGICFLLTMVIYWLYFMIKLRKTVFPHLRNYLTPKLIFTFGVLLIIRSIVWIIPLWIFDSEPKNYIFTVEIMMDFMCIIFFYFMFKLKIVEIAIDPKIKSPIEALKKTKRF